MQTELLPAIQPGLEPPEAGAQRGSLLSRALDGHMPGNYVAHEGTSISCKGSMACPSPPAFSGTLDSTELGAASPLLNNGTQRKRRPNPQKKPK